jgi:hypothetical protein
MQKPPVVILTFYKRVAKEPDGLFIKAYFSSGEMDYSTILLARAYEL